ncbi:unnamed protein product [Microthlaspi erraticum]|uniref:RING-type E3 ubiquitin transferase n=1 Tax=Microthlaspi erraticum TaxID=1685480 RepID=A0A6D2LEF9_9BRAS|nr:unnamed protein product [Microthlaspi erraticum]
MPRHARYVTVGSKIYVVGGFHTRQNDYSSVLSIDCRYVHTVHPISDIPNRMVETVAGMVDEKIYHFVSKIADVGLARLVPASVADAATQYRMTTAGTFCYIDPEYQQTGMLGTKSDIYSFGIMLLQILTAKPPMGLTHHVEKAIEKGNFKDILDSSVLDWPVEEALVAA